MELVQSTLEAFFKIHFDNGCISLRAMNGQFEVSMTSESYMETIQQLQRLGRVELHDKHGRASMICDKTQKQVRLLHHESKTELLLPSIEEHEFSLLTSVIL